MCLFIIQSSVLGFGNGYMDDDQVSYPSNEISSYILFADDNAVNSSGLDEDIPLGNCPEQRNSGTENSENENEEFKEFRSIYSGHEFCLTGSVKVSMHYDPFCISSLFVLVSTPPPELA